MAETTVAQMIEWLKTQDQSAIIEVVMHSSGSGYYDQGGNASTKKFDPTLEVMYEVQDFAMYPPLDPDPNGYNSWRGKKFLLLGMYNG